MQRVIIIAADFILICMAFTALGRDWHHSCDETLRLYGCLCILLSAGDILFELVRCSLESQLDRLQADFRPEEASPARELNERMMTPMSGEMEALGLAVEEGGLPHRGRSAPSPASTTSGAIGGTIRKEKSMKQRRTADLHFWALVFSCFVAVIFSFCAREDEDCAIHMPYLYTYIHTFTYVYIFRLGVLVLWICCRTVKNYEDAAVAAGSMPRRDPSTPMRSF